MKHRDPNKKEVFFSADMHFRHSRVIQYSNRPFANVDEMNQKIIENINSVVLPKDDFYILGDFIWGSAKNAEEFLKQIKCKNIYFILGNHDKDSIRKASISHYFKWVGDYKQISIQNPEDNSVQKICLFHYPILEWDLASKGSWMLHGHTHGNTVYPPSLSNHKITDVGVDCWNYTPVSYTQLKELFKDRQNIQFARD